MILPDITHKGQVVAITNRLVELFKQEHNEKPDGILIRNLRSEFNAVMPSAYHWRRMIWLNEKWNDVLNGNPKYGFPGVPLDNRLAATEKKNELMPIINRFGKWQRDEHNVTVGRLFKERRIAELECRDDVAHHGNPTVADFLANGLPSKNPNANPSTNAAYLQRLIETNPNMTDEQRETVNDTRAQIKQQMYEDDFWDSQLSLDDYRLTKDMPVPPDPLEDFTTYTEVDNGGDLTVTANKVVVDTQLRNVDNHVSKDAGAGHYGDFEHLTSAKLTATVNGSTGAFWALSNQVNDLFGMFTQDVIALYNNTAVADNRFIFRQYTGGVAIDVDNMSNAVIGTDYRFTPSRNGTAAQCLVHDDVDRTSLVDILVFTCDTTTLRYAYAEASYNSGTTQSISYETSDFDFQEFVDGAGVAGVDGKMFGVGKMGLR